MMDQIKKNIEVGPTHKFQGNYLGLVEDDRDPNDWGRIKVRVIGVHSEFSDDESGSSEEIEYLNAIPTKDIPWSKMALGLSRSGGENVIFKHRNEKAVKKGLQETGTGGKFVIPKVGSHVWLFFHNGNHMYPIVWAMAPNKQDWVIQKEKVKKVLDNKFEQIQKFNPKFKPVNAPENGTDWASNASVNVQGDKVFDDTNLELNDQFQKLSDKKWRTSPDLDVRKLRDKKNFSKDFDYEEDEGEKGKQTMRNIECFTNSLGTTYIIDTTEEEETVYKIHKNYMEVIDQNGSRKVFIGRNEDELDEKVGDDDKPPKNKDKRCNDELCVDGDKKTHVLGDVIEYVKGMKSVQVDKCAEIDINESLGVVVRKGDLDIIVQGLTGRTGREDDSTHNSEGAKASDWNGKKQRGNVNIDIQKGDIEMHVGRNINLHVDKDVNLQVDGNMRTTVDKDYHLHVKGHYVEQIDNTKTSYVGQNSEVTVGSFLKENIGSNREITIGGNEQKNISANMSIMVGGSTNVFSGGSCIMGQSNMTITSPVNVSGNVNSGGKVNASGLVGNSMVVGGVEMKDHTHFDAGGHWGGQTPLTGGGGASPTTPTIDIPPTININNASNKKIQDAKRDTKGV